MNWDEFFLKVKRAETPFYARLNRTAKSLMNAEAPYVPTLHRFLYRERDTRINAWREFWRAFYYQPLFRSRCARCGKNLRIYHSGQGLPFISGDVTISIGDNVKMHDKTTIIGLTAGAKPALIVGNDTDLATAVSIFIGREVSIGSHCLIAGTLIADNPGHRKDYRDRLTTRVEPEKMGRVVIEDHVWMAQYSVIIGDVTIGTGAIIGAKAFVNKSVPPFCVVAGVPARIIEKLPFPEEMIEVVGEDGFRRYREATIG
jgi:acetyltransferase-like isoleucine patch superfamily enzyme